MSDSHFSSLGPGGEYRFIHIIAVEDDGQLHVVDPPFGPIDLWLGAGEPGVT